jgi:hypothetical protein
VTPPLPVPRSQTTMPRQPGDEPDGEKTGPVRSPLVTWPRSERVGAGQGGSSQRCEEEMRNTGPCTRNLFLAGAPSTLSGPLCEEDIPQTRTCAADLFLLGAAATQADRPVTAKGRCRKLISA